MKRRPPGEPLSTGERWITFILMPVIALVIGTAACAVV
jgi:hypothetical protein